jgi:hypothetical protein
MRKQIKPDKKSMTHVRAYVNDARWLARCPICNEANRVEPKPDRQIYLVCGSCFPKKMKRVPKRIVNGDIEWGYSRKLQTRAKKKAFIKNQVYIVDFPEDWQAAERVLRKRKVRHQHYLPWKETVKDLERENREDPVLSYLQPEKKPAPSTVIPSDRAEKMEEDPESLDLDDQFMRSIQ